ncbi:MAG: hypothetical protein U1E73_09360 [Planctomycetota bacterium]
MVEHHDLVDHRQFEVCVRVVERNAAVLDEQHEEPAGDDQHHRSHVRQRLVGRIREHAAQAEAAARPRERDETEEQRGFGEPRERHLARGAHARMVELVSERGGRGEEPAERKEIGKQQHVAREADHGRMMAQRHHQGAGERRGEGDCRAGEEHARSRGADHHLFLQQLPGGRARLQ